MKKSLYAIVLSLLLVTALNAQVMNVHLKGGKVIPFKLADIEKVTYDSAAQETSEPQKTLDAMISEMTQMAAMAQQYYRKPVTLGGGGNRFRGWVIPETMKDTKSGTYEADIEDDIITLKGTCKAKNTLNKPMGADMVIGKDIIKSVTIK